MQNKVVEAPVLALFCMAIQSAPADEVAAAVEP